MAEAGDSPRPEVLDVPTELNGSGNEPQARPGHFTDPPAGADRAAR